MLLGNSSKTISFSGKNRKLGAVLSPSTDMIAFVDLSTAKGESIYFYIAFKTLNELPLLPYYSSLTPLDFIPNSFALRLKNLQKL